MSMNISMLHRIETGKWQRPPADHVIKRIAEELELNIDTLEHDFEEDRKANAEAKQLGRAELTPLEVIEADLALARDKMRNGRPQFAASLLPSKVVQLQHLASSGTSRDKKRINQRLAQICSYLVYAYAQTSYAEKIENPTADYVKCLKTVNDTLTDNDDNREDYEMGLIAQPDILYVAGKVEASSPLFRSLLKDMRTSLPTMTCHRGIVVAYAKLLNQGKIDEKEAYEQIQKDLESPKQTAPKDWRGFA